jgi:hypothetical protein
VAYLLDYGLFFCLNQLNYLNSCAVLDYIFAAERRKKMIRKKTLVKIKMFYILKMVLAMVLYIFTKVGAY